MTRRMTIRARVRVRRDVALREIDGEFYALTADSTFHAITDEVGAFIMRRVVGEPGITVARLLAAVEDVFDTSGHDVAADVLAFVSLLEGKGILMRCHSRDSEVSA